MQDFNDFFTRYIEDHPAPEVVERKEPVPSPQYCTRCREILSNGEVGISDPCPRCQREIEQGYGSFQLLGRLRNGAARDHGILTHAVKNGEWRAVCGAQPGRRSVGWVRSYGDETITCPRCVK